MRSPSACENVTNARLLDETYALAGSDVGHVRIRVAIDIR